MNFKKLFISSCVLFTLTACNSGTTTSETPASVEEQSSADEQNTETEQPVQEAEPEATPEKNDQVISVSVGDPAHVDGMEMLVSEVTYTSSQQADLEDGKELVNFIFECKNTNDHSVTLHIDGFSLEKADGSREYAMLFTTTSAENVTDENIIGPQGSLNAVISFEVNSGEEPLILHYEDLVEFLYY